MENFDKQRLNLSMQKYEQALNEHKKKNQEKIAQQRQKMAEADRFIAERNAAFNADQNPPVSGGIHNSQPKDQSMAQIIQNKSGRNERTDPRVTETRERRRVRSLERAGRTR